MADEQVGTGYVLIKPKMDDGAKASLEQSGKSSGSGFGTAFQVAAGNLIAGAVTSIASAAVDVFKNAFSNFADYEQLVGGVETLFGESASVVQGYAENAFRTAGLSANEYMETVTGFSASLLQSLGGDTEAAAAYADMAVTDMADNANKMGTSMESIQNAYQGFAKQNYTMLDNLKLGYGGTKSEMERLLADASKIAGVEFNIDNYNDVIEAIHVMQESMGIAGTTMEEGASTISGSIAMTKAAWQNLLTGLADPNADLGKLFGDLIESGAAVLENSFPVILNVITRLFTQVPQVVGRLIMELPGKVRPLLESAFGEGMGGAMADGLQRALETISTIFNEIYSVIEPIVSAIVGFIQEHWPEISAVISAVMDAVSAVISTVWPVIKGIVETVMTAIGAVVQAVWPVIVTIVEAASAAIRRAMEALQPLVQTVTGIFEGIKQAITHPIETAKGIISGIIETIKGFFSNFHIELPHIKLPHFGIEPAGWQIGDLLEGKIPHLAINWYAQGGIVDGPTLIGAGEAGPELILPQSGATMDAFADTVARRVGGGINVQNMTVITDSPEDFMRQLTSFAARTRRQYA